MFLSSVALTFWVWSQPLHAGTEQRRQRNLCGRDTCDWEASGRSSFVLADLQQPSPPSLFFPDRLRSKGGLRHTRSRSPLPQQTGSFSGRAWFKTPWYLSKATTEGRIRVFAFRIGPGNHFRIPTVTFLHSHALHCLVRRTQWIDQGTRQMGALVCLC